MLTLVLLAALYDLPQNCRTPGECLDECLRVNDCRTDDCFDWCIFFATKTRG